jgi:hypothetical protein
MIKLIAILALAASAPACLDNTPASWQPGGGTFTDGTVSSSWNGTEAMRDTTGAVHDVTVSARDLGGDGTVVNSQTYASLDHGFTLELPGGHYKLDVTDVANHVVATYFDVVVDGDVKLGPPNTIAQ